MEVRIRHQGGGAAVKCDAIGCSADQDKQCRGLCFVCFTKRRFAGEEEEAKWDREHRKPKELVIEVEVPKGWIQVAYSKAFSHSIEGYEIDLEFGNPPGRLVLKARKETL